MPINNDIEFRGEIDRMLDPDRQPADEDDDFFDRVLNRDHLGKADCRPEEGKTDE